MRRGGRGGGHIAVAVLSCCEKRVAAAVLQEQWSVRHVLLRVLWPLLVLVLFLALPVLVQRRMRPLPIQPLHLSSLPFAAHSGSSAYRLERITESDSIVVECCLPQQQQQQGMTPMPPALGSRRR